MVLLDGGLGGRVKEVDAVGPEAQLDRIASVEAQ